MALAVGACRGEYSQPPTACDDYCKAVERADCSDDYPADCVRDCEKSRASGVCRPGWQTLDDCYASADASTFTCVNDRGQPGRVCLPERRALGECLSPGSGPCFDQCLRQVDACGATLSDCEANCQNPTPGCEVVAHDFDACLLTFPVECRDAVEADPPPCFDQALALLACAK